MVNDMSQIKLFNILLMKKSYHLLSASPYAEGFMYMTSFSLDNNSKSKQITLFYMEGK